MVAAYLDSSVVFSTLVSDRHTDRVQAWLRRAPSIAFSLWTLTEVSSALSHAVRTKVLTPAERRAAEARLERRFEPARASTIILTDDFLKALALLTAHDALRAPDALHLAIAERNGWALATLDHKLAAAATGQGVPLALP